jgi:predicted ATP-grasp superfamily ATP-dependent carboligase
MFRPAAVSRARALLGASRPESRSKSVSHSHGIRPLETSDVLVVGMSTRAIAESAARAGFAVAALDGFADLDQHPSVRAWSTTRDFGVRATAGALVRAGRTLAAEHVVNLSPVENHPQLVTELAAGRTLWGNPARVLRAVRNPFRVADALRVRAIAMPALFRRDPGGPADLLLKPRASGGGSRVRRWRPGTPVPHGFYLQERIEGPAGSAAFVAAGGKAVLLAVSRQLVGDHAFGAAGYRYCGTILDATPGVGDDAGLAGRARDLVQAVAAAFDLVGVNGVDFIARDGLPLPIEINPRWSSSMELVERAAGCSVFGAHAEACISGALPASDLSDGGGPGAIGKAIVYARHEVIAGDTRPWLDDDGVRDVPHPGERIRPGAPICTVFARGADGGACYSALAHRAARVYEQLDAMRPRPGRADRSPNT